MAANDWEQHLDKALWKCSRCATCAGKLKYKCYGPKNLELHVLPNANFFRVFVNRQPKESGTIDKLKEKIDSLLTRLV